MSFFYCIATLLEFAGVHYFTKIGSGEIAIEEEEWEDCEVHDDEEMCTESSNSNELSTENAVSPGVRQRSLICPIYKVKKNHHICCDGMTKMGEFQGSSVGYGNRKTLCSYIQPLHPDHHGTMERTTQTETLLSRWKQFFYCLMGNDEFRKKRQREAAALGRII